ncbi:MAG: DUF547 domain-containing protein [Myxococcaceae bacterium]|jgi:hypothetical protein|nr:DUF547 domain-containing protein [Myxococcaceae bacterium]
MDSRPLPAWLRLAGFTVSVLLVVGSALVLWLDGRVPAEVPDDAPAYATADLLAALTAVDRQGRVDVEALRARREPLDRFIAAMAKTAPATSPERFPGPDERVAFWLNAAHALVLQQLLDTPGARSADDLSRWQSWPIGGQRLTRAAIERRFLAEAGDGRVWLALFDGSVSGGVLDSAPFGGDTINPQLDDAARRFLRRRATVTLAPPVVRLSPRITSHEADFLAALPEGRSGVLQIVWAYLPESCDGLFPGCDTRADLDRACGVAFDRCRVEPMEEDRRLVR